MRSLANHDRGILAYDVAFWIAERFGPEGAARVMENLTPETRAMFTNPVPNAWYPVELMAELYSVLDETFTPQDPEALISLGRFMAHHGVRGFIKFLVSLISVKPIIWRISSLWRYYHEGGSVEVPILIDDGKHHEGILAVKDYDAGGAWCKILEGYIEVLVASTGATNVKVKKTSCIHSGDKICSWLVNWED